MKNTTFQISQKEYEHFLGNWMKLLPQFAMQELELQEYIKLHPDNTNKQVVSQKVYLLNKFYSTRVPREIMVNNILDIKDLDKRLRAGDSSLVSEIAHVGKTYYSFATKFCSMHQPNKYPIYDSLVWSFFEYLGKQNFFSSTYKLFNSVKNSKNGYSNYIQIYKEFIKKSNIKNFYVSYRKVDTYIWGYFQVYILYHCHQKEANDIFPDIFTGVASCAIWEIMKNILN